MSTKTDPSTLPQWKGRPVPWITRWTGQIITTPVAARMDSQGRLFAWHDGPQNRDQLGFLWGREALNRVGRPEFGAVSTYRQRASIGKRLCQVCGNKIPPGVIHWLHPQDEMGPDPSLTITGPTCEGCVELSLELCPHLSENGHLMFRVLEYEVAGAYGGYFELDEAGRAQVQMGVYNFSDPTFAAERFVATQLVARLTKYVME